MADRTPDSATPRDAVDARVRAAFAAEHADMERRVAASDGAPPGRTPASWVPLAAAAAVIALLAIGVAVLGGRGDDDPVDVGTAAAPTETPDTGGPAAAPTDEADPAPAAEPSATAVGSPTESPTAPEEQPAPQATSTPSPWFPSAPNECGERVSFGTHFVWDVSADDPDGGLVAHASAGVDEPVTRVLPHDAVVAATGGCRRTADGAAWHELFAGNDARDWVNARYLRVAEGACLAVERNVEPEPFFHTVQIGDTIGQLAEIYNVAVEAILAANPGLGGGGDLTVGQLVRIPGQGTGPRFHTVQAGDLLSSIAERYGVSVGALIAANPQMDPNLILEGEQLRIPDEPLAVAAVFDGDTVAFAFGGATTYDLDASGRITPGRCSNAGEARTPVCLSGEIVLYELGRAEPLWSGVGPMTAWRTAPATVPVDSSLQPVAVLTPDDETLSGYVDPGKTELTDGQCIFTGGTDLESAPCARVSGADRTAGLGTDGAGRSWQAGTAASIADHVHDIAVESNDQCTRLVVTFGEGANEAEDLVAELPRLVVVHGLDWVSVRPDGWTMESSFDDPMRVDYATVGYGTGIGLLTVSFNFDFTVEFMHADAEPHVRFFEDPARVVIDLFPSGSAGPPSVAGLAFAPYGERFVLRQPIQTDLFGPGIPAGEPIVVFGYGRPFEAAGLYRIWRVAEDVDVDAFLRDPGEPLVEEFFPTGGWAEAWGVFQVTLPDLDPGSYIVVFGELPPTDEIGFYGTGQLFRITDPDDAESQKAGTYPEAMLLPNVQLAPES